MVLVSVAFIACGGDDDNGGSNSSGDFIEVTIDGKTYHKEMYGIYGQATLGKNGMVLTGTMEDLFDDEGFRFFMGLTHSEKKENLLSSPLGNYRVVDDLRVYNEPDNLSLYPQYDENKHNYKLGNGSHQVTSIKQTKNGVQVCGTFNITMYYHDDSVLIKGKYAMTVLI